MKDLKIYFCDFWPDFLETENIFTPLLSKHFNVIIDNKNPDIIFHSIFNRQQEIQKYNNVKKILFIGENYRPSKFETNYSISFDPHSETNYRLPLWQYYLILNPNLKEKIFNYKFENPSYDRFCFFTVSNSNNFIRNGFYNQLSQYKFIHSYGRYLTNNFELQNLSKGRYWREAKDEFFKKTKHKFSICFENNTYPYYCTEKLMDGFLGHGIPIYWGDPKVSEDWNEKSFINVVKLGNQKSIELIKELDNNNRLYTEYKQNNCFIEEQKEKHLKNIDEFENWLIKIILE